MTLEKSQISIEQLVESIVREVIAELTKRGVAIGSPGVPERNVPAGQAGGGLTLEIDMRAYRTPVLTESQLTRIDTKVSTIIVPCTTVVTPGAWGIIRSKKLTLVRKTQPKR
jgi:hypothetical protein